MPGLPRGADVTRPKNAFALVVLEPLERLTTSLRRGDPFSEEALQDMLAMQRRLDGFSAALRDRMRQHGMDDPLIEDAE